MSSSEKYPSRKYALFFPVLSVSFTKLVIVFLLAVVVCLSFLLPSTYESGGSGEWLYRMAVDHLADVGFMAQTSSYPFVIAISYSAAMGFALIMAVVYSITVFPDYPFAKLEIAGRWRRIGLMIFAVLVIVMPVIHGLPVSSAHRSYGFFEKVSESRLYICIWSVGFTGVAFLAWFAVFFEVSRIFKRSK